MGVKQSKDSAKAMVQWPFTVHFFFSFFFKYGSLGGVGLFFLPPISKKIYVYQHPKMIRGMEKQLWELSLFFSTKIVRMDTTSLQM